MRRPGGNHLDQRRRRLPRDYVDPPAGFGLDPKARLILPPDGDRVSAQVAALQHELVLAWRRQAGRLSGAALARRFGCSRQTWSRMTLGERWMGETLLVALIVGLRSPTADPMQGCR